MTDTSNVIDIVEATPESTTPEVGKLESLKLVFHNFKTPITLGVAAVAGAFMAARVLTRPEDSDDSDDILDVTEV